MKLKTIDVISVSCATHRDLGGYFKDDWCVSKRSNRECLTAHFFGKGDISVLEEDRILAVAAIEYLKGLALKSFQRKLSDYELKVLKIVAQLEFNPKMIGLAASIPSMYLKQLVSDNWFYKEQEIGRDSDFVGHPTKRISKPLTVQFVKHMERFDNWLTCCTDDSYNIVIFELEA